MYDSFTLTKVLPSFCHIGGYAPKSNLITICSRPHGVYKYIMLGFELDNVNRLHPAYKIINFK